MSHSNSSLTGVLLALSLLTNGVLGVGLYVMSQQEPAPAPVAVPKLPEPEPEPDPSPRKQEDPQDVAARLAALERVAQVVRDSPQPLEDLAALLREQGESERHDKYLRETVLDTLATSGPDAVGPLVAAVKDPRLSDETRDEAAFALGQMRPAPLALPVGMLEDPDPGIRYRAALTIARIGLDARQAVPHLRSALKREKDETVRFYLQQALKQIEP